jgi:hypothetical protein
MLAQGHAWPSVATTAIGVGPSLELACAFAGWDERGALPAGVSAWASTSEAMNEARRALAGRESEAADDETPQREYWPLGSKDALESARATFLLRFRRLLRERSGLTGNGALAIAMAAFEMADNTIQPSGPDAEHPAAGAWGVEVHSNRVCFAIVDRGRGMFRSLTSSNKWKHLESAREALEAGVLRHASRRRDGDGGGFRDLTAALADLSGTLRFATDDVVLQLDGSNQAQRVHRRQNRPLLRGPPEREAGERLAHLSAFRVACHRLPGSYDLPDFRHSSI